MPFEKFFGRDPIVIEGTVVEKGDRVVAIQVHPGLVIEIAQTDAQKVEKTTDQVTGRALLRVTLSPDATISAAFQPRVARAALADGIPFSIGGPPPPVAGPPTPVGVPMPGDGGGDDGVGRERPPIPAAVAAPRRTEAPPVGGGVVPPPQIRQSQPTIGTFYTSSYNLFWGYANDDVTYSDWGAGNTFA